MNVAQYSNQHVVIDLFLYLGFPKVLVHGAMGIATRGLRETWLLESPRP